MVINIWKYKKQIINVVEEFYNYSIRLSNDYWQFAFKVGFYDKKAGNGMTASCLYSALPSFVWGGGWGMQR